MCIIIYERRRIGKWENSTLWLGLSGELYAIGYNSTKYRFFLLYYTNMVYNSFMSRIAECLKRERKNAGLTQADFALRSGLSLKFVRDLEQGKPTVRLDKASHALEMFGKELVPCPIGSGIHNQQVPGLEDVEWSSSARKAQRTYLDFCSYADELLNADSTSADIAAYRFRKFIETNSIVRNIISSVNPESAPSWTKFYEQNTESGWYSFTFPRERQTNVAVSYNYLCNILDRNRSIVEIAERYNWGVSTYSECVQHFMRTMFDPIISYIELKLSQKLVALNNTSLSASIVNNINSSQGVFVQSIGGDAANHTNPELWLATRSSISDAIKTLKKLSPNSFAELCEVIDSLEMADEQLASKTPKKVRLQKALDGIKAVSRVLAETVISEAAKKALSSIDWGSIIQNINNILMEL